MKEVLFNTHDLALSFTIYQCLLFSLFAITLKRGKRSSNILLSLFLLTQAAIPLDNLINFGEVFRFKALEFSPNIFYTFGLGYWLEAPLLLFYVRSLIYKNFHFKPIDLVYFLPFLLYFVYFYVNWLAVDNDVKLLTLQGEVVADASTLDRGIHLFREVFRFCCGLLCLVELRRYKKLLINEVSELESVNLNWLNILAIGFVFIEFIAIFVAIAIFSSYELHVVLDHETLGLMSNYAVMFLVSVLIFFSASHSTLFKGVDDSLVVKQNKKQIEPELLNKIEQYMQLHKPFLNPLLTQENLANQLEIAPRTLSIIINHHYKKNFFEFINNYRIEESKALLVKANHQKTTMLDIMDMAGFNSKATFNTFFKKLTGVTPTQYRKEFGMKESEQKV